MTAIENQRASLKAAVIAGLGDEIATLSRLEEYITRTAPIFGPDLSEADLQELSVEIEKERIWDMGEGIAFASATHVPWMEQRKIDINWPRWEAYRNLLVTKGIPPKVIDSMSSRNDRILDLAGDPTQAGNWSRRGLVIGDVQSGKTGNYLGLFNKAADAGYKVFILLAGHTDKLRQQTQARVDEGFIGRDTRLIQLNNGSFDQGATNRIGIGISKVSTDSLTSYYEDFSAAKVGTVFHIDEDRPPVVFVIKKNKTILRNLTNFLNASLAPGQKILSPMVLLDDEADYASINTKPSASEATAINTAIRDLLRVFDRNSYIGFTATPFANVLIDDEIEDDLFPRNFIYSLEAPDNYFGPREMFDDSPLEENRFLQPLFDAESSFPFKHKSDLTVKVLPESLREAIRSFFLANALRDLRANQSTKPRSMLINVSRFVKVQQQVFNLVSEAVSNMRDALTYERQTSSSDWGAIRMTFENQFSSAGPSWDAVREILIESIGDISVHVVNSQKGAAAWDAVYEGPRARVIAIGGDYLSRGLTLEGLMTSYFYRRSLAYDTLMQMGRWFGYRDGYTDLCRLWIDDEVALWFRDIADAIDELRDDLSQMSARKLEPKDFGLAVKCHPGAMMTVTARNKSLSGTPTPKNVSLWNKVRETSRLQTSPEALHKNWEALAELVSKITDSPALPNSARNTFVRTQVPQVVIGNFLQSYQAADSDPIFAGTDLASFVKSSTSKILASWDVIIMGGNGPTNELVPSQNLAIRSIHVPEGETTAYVSAKSRRLGGSADISQVLEADVVRRLKKESSKEMLSSEDYSKEIERPVLIVYPIISKGDQTIEPQMQGIAKTTEFSNPFVGISVAFPKQASSGDSDALYMANTVWKRLMAKSVVGPADDVSEIEEIDEF